MAALFSSLAIVPPNQSGEFHDLVHSTLVWAPSGTLLATARLARERAHILGPGAAKLREAFEGFAKVLLQLVLILGVHLNVFPVLLIPQEDHVGDKHHLMSALPYNRLARLLVPALDNPVDQRSSLG